MTSTTVELRDALARLPELLSLVAAGTEVILTDGQMPLARLLPVTGRPRARVAGLHAGAIQISDDFDVPLPEEFWTGSE